MTSAHPDRMRAISQFHENPRVIAAWQRTAGPMLAWLTPARRRALLLVGSVVVLLRKPARMIQASGAEGAPDATLIPVTLLLLLGFLWLWYKVAQQYSRLPEAVRRRPQLALHATFWALMAGLWLTSGATGAWRAAFVGLAIVLPFVLWRCGYMLLSAQRGRMAGTRFRDHLVYMFPLWGGTDTPYGKGLDYLSRCEARTAEALARSQLAGARLIVLGLTWSAVGRAMDATVYAVPDAARWPALALGVPHVAQLVNGVREATLLSTWASIYCELVRDVLGLAARGHVIIGILRLFGFNVFRNTYKPLLAESISAFWNRYFYYFKELLSELFFMPVFARWFRGWNRLRLFVAVMAAAGFGNLYYHVLKQDELLLAGDFEALWLRYRSRAVYCALLAIGIFVSMLREQSRRGVPPPPGLHRRVIRIAGVWTFFGLIYIWHGNYGVDPWARAQFLLQLFGLA